MPCPVRARPITRRRSKSPDQGRGEALAGAVAAAVPARRDEPRRAGDADRLRHRRRRRPRRMRCASFRNFNDWVQALAVQRDTLAPNFRKARSRGRSRSTPITPRTRRRISTATNTSSKSAAWSTTRSPWTLAELNKLPEVSQITRHGLRRGLERDRLLAGRAAVRFSQTDRRRHQRQICLVPVRRRLFQHHRHADRAASADAADAQIRPQDPAAAPTAFRSRSAFPTKLGFKNPKYVTAMWVQNNDAGGYWENQGYNWFSGL